MGVILAWWNQSWFENREDNSHWVPRLQIKLFLFLLLFPTVSFWKILSYRGTQFQYYSIILCIVYFTNICTAYTFGGWHTKIKKDYSNAFSNYAGVFPSFENPETMNLHVCIQAICAIELRRCPKTTEITSLSHSDVLADIQYYFMTMNTHTHTHTHHSLFWLTCTILLPEILTRAPKSTKMCFWILRIHSSLNLHTLYLRGLIQNVCFCFGSARDRVKRIDCYLCCPVQLQASSFLIVKLSLRHYDIVNIN